ncbi:MAG: methyltransferase [Deinococcales bacterium]|nr:methyltransferase [Chitinophagaceae bacterium]
MANDYFAFKQFVIQQADCAMKVTTDGCLFGTWTAKTVNDSQLPITKTLDIGTGTGLLSLMLAQKINTQIDAVEIDAAAAMQAQANFEASPWTEHLKVYQTPIQMFNTATSHQYNFIVTNPPFFEHDLKSSNAKRNMALHSAALSLETLLASIHRLLAANGQFAILLPYHRVSYFINLTTTYGFVLHQQVLVKQTPKHTYFRAMLLFGFTQKTMVETEIIIKTEDAYSEDFKILLKDYYLQL